MSCWHYQHWPTKPGAEAGLKKNASRFIFSRWSLKNCNNLYRDLVQLFALISLIHIWKVFCNYRILFCLTMCLRDSSECDPMRDSVEVKIFVKNVGKKIFFKANKCRKSTKGKNFLKENYSGRSQIYQSYYLDQCFAFIKFLPLESNTVVFCLFGFYTGILCGTRAENVVINHLVNISSKDGRSKTALLVNLLHKYSRHYISCVCITPFVPHTHWREGFVLYVGQRSFTRIDTV